MRYRLLGDSGLRVSEASLGTMTFGEEWGWGTAKDESRKVYDAFREAGGNFIDTANVYTNGSSETFLGEFMKDHREGVVLATKYNNAFPGKDPNAAGNHRKSMGSTGATVPQSLSSSTSHPPGRKHSTMCRIADSCLPARQNSIKREQTRWNEPGPSTSRGSSRMLCWRTSRFGRSSRFK